MSPPNQRRPSLTSQPTSRPPHCYIRYRRGNCVGDGGEEEEEDEEEEQFIRTILSHISNGNLNDIDISGGGDPDFGVY